MVQPSDNLHLDSTGDLKICNRSNRGPCLLPTISFVEDNSPAKAGLVRGCWVYIKGRRKPRRGRPKNIAQTEHKYIVKKGTNSQREGEKGGATQRRVSLVIVLVPAEEEPENQPKKKK